MSPTAIEPRQSALLDEAGAQAAESPSAGSVILMFERLARDPSVDVAKLEKLIDMQERILKHHAKAAFDGAFARMQPDLPEIDERGQIKNRAGAVQSTYAKLEDIHSAITPVLKTHGFSIRHRTEWPADKPTIIRIVGILSHDQGHSEESTFEATLDKSEYRTDIQSMGSTVSYGRRYTTIDLLNIVTRAMDNDGAGGRPKGAPTPPAGYAAWMDTMADVVVEGTAKLEAAWKGAKSEYRTYAATHDAKRWGAMKARAEAVK